jgi:hypothetical protein
MSITIRPLGDADREPWEVLFKGYIRFYEAKVPDDVIALTWAGSLRSRTGYSASLASTKAGARSGWRTRCSTARRGRRLRTVILRISTSIATRAGTVWAAPFVQYRR